MGEQHPGHSVTFNERVVITVNDGVADVVLSRPDKMNALDIAMFDALAEAGAWVGAQPQVRAVVLRGAGKGFCAGLDMSIFNDSAAIKSLEARTHGIANRFQQAAWVWHVLPVPVIAALHGPCLGGGLQLALGADIRIAHPQTSMSVMEIKWGLVPDMAFTVLAPGLARADVVRELVYSGRIFSGAEAQGIGFVTRVADDPHAGALALAQTLAAKSPHAMRAAKRLLNCTPQDIAAALLAESVAADALVDSPNQREAVLANLQKRPAVFTDAEC